MKVKKINEDLVEIELNENDVKSAIMQFICACHPEYSQGWIIDAQGVNSAMAVIHKHNEEATR